MLRLWRAFRYQIDLLSVRITLLFTALFLGVAVYLNTAVLGYLHADLFLMEQQQALARLQVASAEAVADIGKDEPDLADVRLYATYLLDKAAGADMAVYDLDRQLVLAVSNSRLPKVLAVTPVATSPMTATFVPLLQPLDDNNFLLASAVVLQSIPIGWQAIRLDLSAQQAVYRQLTTRFTNGLLIALALILAGGVYLRSYTRRNMQPLIEMTRRIAQSHWDTQLSGHLTGEFRYLGDAMVQMQENLVIYEQQRQTLLNRISHDILSPLKTVSTIAAVHQDQTPSAFMQNDWNVVYSCAEHVNRLIEDLRYLMSRGINYRPRHQAADLEIVTMLQQVVAYYEAKTKARSLVFSVQLDAPAAVLCTPMEPTRFQQILGNLLDNALTHGRATAIMFSLGQPRAGWIELKVQDNGIGIDEQTLPQIFREHFTTARRASPTNQGLGLAIIADIVHAHAGAIKVESKPQHGTTFTIRLPAGSAGQ